MFKYENDSRKVMKGQTFIAIKGLTVDGHDYIDKAIENGASEIICEKDLDIDIPYTKVDDTSEYEKELLKKEYGDILDKLNIIGVTGSNGKTTTVNLIYRFLKEEKDNVILGGNIGTPLSHYVLALLKMCYENQKLAKILFASTNKPYFLNSILQETYNKCSVRWKKERPDISLDDIEYATVYMFNGTLGIVNYWIQSDFDKTDEEVANIINDLVYYGIKRFIYKK